MIKATIRESKTIVSRRWPARSYENDVLQEKGRFGDNRSGRRHPAANGGEAFCYPFMLWVGAIQARHHGPGVQQQRSHWRQFRFRITSLRG